MYTPKLSHFDEIRSSHTNTLIHAHLDVASTATKHRLTLGHAQLLVQTRCLCILDPQTTVQAASPAKLGAHVRVSSSRRPSRPRQSTIAFIRASWLTASCSVNCESNQNTSALRNSPCQSRQSVTAQWPWIVHVESDQIHINLNELVEQGSVSGQPDPKPTQSPSASHVSS